MSPRRTTPTAPAAEAAPTKGETTRTRLLAAAHKLFLKQGFHGTSMREIADAAGIAVGGIYNHFGTKEAIFAAVLDAYHPYHVILPALEATQGETVEAFVRDAAARVKAGLAGAEKGIMPLAFMELVEFQGRHIRQLARKMMPPLLNFVQRFTQRRGRLREVPLPIMLRALLGMTIGYLVSEIILRGLKGVPGLDLDEDRWFDGMIDIYLYGILEVPEES